MTSWWNLHGSKFPPFSIFWRRQEEVAKLSADCRTSEWNDFLMRFFFSYCSRVLYMTVSDFSIKTKMGFPPSASTHSRQWVILWTGTRNPPSPVHWGHFGNLSHDISSCANGRASFSSTDLQISPKYTHLVGGQMGDRLRHIFYFYFSNVFHSMYFLMYAAARTLQFPYCGIIKTDYSILVPPHTHLHLSWVVLFITYWPNMAHLVWSELC